MTRIYLIVFTIFVASLSVAEKGIHLKQDYQADSQGGYYDRIQARYKANQKIVETTTRKSEPSLTQKSNVTAWGIIGIILGVIILSTITYYVFILYPYICKKSQSYDVIDLTDVNSVCTISDNGHTVPLFRNSNDASANR